MYRKKITIYLSLIILSIIVLNILHYSEIKKCEKKFPNKNINVAIDESLKIPEVKKENYIPKIIYRVCNTKEYLDKFKKPIDMTQEVMKGYELKIYFDQDIIDFIKENYPEDVLYLFNKINPEYYPSKVDLFRYLLIYKKGGIYLDAKSVIKENIDPLIQKYGDKLFAVKGKWYKNYLNLIDNFYIKNLLNYNQNWSYFSGTPYGEYNNWIIISPAGNPILKQVILQTLSNIKYGLANNNYIHGEISVLAMTGPLMYTRVITEHKDKEDYKLFNSRIDNKVAYSIFNHKKLLGDKHYKKIKNKKILIDNY